MIRRFCICLFIFLDVYGNIVQAQSDSRYVIRGGYEVANNSASRPGSFSERNAYNVGLEYLTEMKRAKDSTGAILFGIELNYTKTYRYQHNVNRFMSDGRYNYYELYDNQYELAFIDCGLSLGSNIRIRDNMVISFFGGSSIGLGLLDLTPQLKSLTIIATGTGTNGGEGGPAYGGSSFELPFSLNAGVKFFYKCIMIDVRYRQILPTLKNGDDPPKSFNNIFVQLGVGKFL
jgi:hypothetical protein